MKERKVTIRIKHREAQKGKGIYRGRLERYDHHTQVIHARILGRIRSGGNKIVNYLDGERGDKKAQQPHHDENDGMEHLG